MRRNPSLIALLAVALTATACGPKPPVPVVKRPDGTIVEAPPPPKQEDEQAARQAADEANRLEAAGDAEGARVARAALLERYPATAAAAELYEAQAKQAAAAGNSDEAVAQYEKLLFFRPGFERISEAREAYAKLLLEVGRPQDAAAMLRALYQGGQSSAAQIQLGVLLADALSRSGSGKQAVEVLVDLMSQQLTGAELRGDLHRRAVDVIDSGLGFRDAEELWGRVQNDAAWAALQPPLALKLAKVYYHTRAYDQSEQMLNVVTTRYAKSEYAAPAQEFLKRLRARFAVNPRAIGVVLPLSGKFQQYGERSLRAIELAFGEGSGYQLIVKDSRGEALDAANAVEQLVLEHNVIAIIGDLFSAPATAAAQKAEELSVPIISLSYGEGLPQLGGWVFRAALTVEAQAKGLARVAFEDLGISRFAILYPRSRYGVDFATAFWREVEKRQGEVRGAQSYEHDQTTFKEQVAKLVGRWYRSARRDYNEAIRELRAKNLPSHRFQAAVEKLEKSLPPIVDFDAIVIPDSAQNVGLIAPALAFEDIVMTRDPKMLERIRKATGQKEITPVTLLGGSTWNHPLITRSCEQYCEDSVFVDGYFPDSTDPKVRDFVAAYREKVGAEPVLSDAQAFDAGGLLKQVLTSARAAEREALRTALVGLTAYHGVTGTMKFDEQGETAKDLFVLTIKEHTIRLRDPAKQPGG